MPVPEQPKIYHIVHVDRLSSIVADGCLWCDAEAGRRNSPGTVIGMSTIKERRLRLPLRSRPDLCVGDCVPFYFCQRSIMLYMIDVKSSELIYEGGQEPIIHLEADFHGSVAWAEQNSKRWAFTSSNAGSYIFNDYCNLSELNEIDWVAIQANQWQNHKRGKQAEFLLEKAFPWHLIERIGVYSPIVCNQVANILPVNGHRPPIEVMRSWYY